MDFPFRKGPVDLDAILPMVLSALTGKRTCIQAGGCVGVWPLMLAQIFERVITFEPEIINFRCMRENVAGVANIEIFHAALWSTATETMKMGLDEKYHNNCGAYFVELGGDIHTATIDSLGLDDVDLLALDIEGAEYDALMGGADTIARCRPLIVLEDKGHNERFGGKNAVALCKEMGYREIGRPTPWDVVLAI